MAQGRTSKTFPKAPTGIKRANSSVGSNNEFGYRPETTSFVYCRSKLFMKMFSLIFPSALSKEILRTFMMTFELMMVMPLLG